jgi:hypothetical protein
MKIKPVKPPIAIIDFFYSVLIHCSAWQELSDPITTPRYILTLSLLLNLHATIQHFKLGIYKIVMF